VSSVPGTPSRDVMTTQGVTSGTPSLSAAPPKSVLGPLGNIATTMGAVPGTDAPKFEQWEKGVLSNIA
jgi:hypothetical protein